MVGFVECCLEQMERDVGFGSEEVEHSFHLRLDLAVAFI